MALTDPINTLSFNQSRVLTSHRDMGHVPVVLVAKAVSKFLSLDSHPNTVPETEALWFYGMNHGMALIAADKAPLEPLNEWELGFVQTYHRMMGPKAVRAFYYLLLICTRESRHNKSLVTDLPKIKAQFGSEVWDFLQSVNGGEAGIHKALLSSPPNTTIGNYVECLRWQFYNSKWNGGYGGKAWGQVTDCLSRFVKGEFTAEMMLDTVWTLSHNNGPIFNKGICYGHYDMGSLLRILDVQRSGQVPEGVLFDATISQYAAPELKGIMLQLKEQYDDKIGFYVDWEVVEALGAVGHYGADKQKQHKLHGMSEAAKKAQAEALKKAKAEAEKAAMAQAEFEKKWFTVMSGLHVEKIQRAA